MAVGVLGVEHIVLAVEQTVLAHAFPERGDVPHLPRRVARPDPRDARQRLRPHGRRHCERARSKRKEKISTIIHCLPWLAIMLACAMGSRPGSSWQREGLSIY